MQDGVRAAVAEACDPDLSVDLVGSLQLTQGLEFVRLGMGLGVAGVRSGQRRQLQGGQTTSVIISSPASSVTATTSALQAATTTSLTAAVQTTLPSYSGVTITLLSVDSAVSPTQQPTAWFGATEEKSKQQLYVVVGAVVAASAVCLAVITYFWHLRAVKKELPAGKKAKEEGDWSDTSSELSGWEDVELTEVFSSDGKRQLVDLATDQLYNESGDYLGKWEGGGRESSLRNPVALGHHHMDFADSTAPLPIALVNHLTGFGLDAVNLMAAACQTLAPPAPDKPKSRHGRFEWVEAATQQEIEAESERRKETERSVH